MRVGYSSPGHGGGRGGGGAGWETADILRCQQHLASQGGVGAHCQREGVADVVVLRLRCKHEAHAQTKYLSKIDGEGAGVQVNRPVGRSLPACSGGSTKPELLLLPSPPGARTPAHRHGCLINDTMCHRLDPNSTHLLRVIQIGPQQANLCCR